MNNVTGASPARIANPRTPAGRLAMVVAATCLLATAATCDGSPTVPTGVTGAYALVEYAGVPVPMPWPSRAPIGLDGPFCATLIQSQILELGGDRAARLTTRERMECDDGRQPVPDSSAVSGSYRATPDSVVVSFPARSGGGLSAPDSVSWRITRSGDRLIFPLGSVYTPEGPSPDTLRLIFKRT